MNTQESEEKKEMKKVKDYYSISIVEIEISGGDRTNDNDFFTNKITFIFDPLEDAKNGKHSLYDLCEKVVDEYEKENINNECIYNAFAKVYTLDRQLKNQFDVL